VNLTAALVTRNEVRRYLPIVVEHLLAFCDTVVVLDDGSDDGTRQWLCDHEEEGKRLQVSWQPRSTFYQHEGRIRQSLLDLTLAQKPTAVLSLDADELVSDGAVLREYLDRDPDVAIWSLAIAEVWQADASSLWTRQDGGWRTHPLCVLWRIEPGATYRMMNRKLACGRVPTRVIRSASRAVPTGESLFHFGWTDESERVARHARYTKHDGGRFHRSDHLDSILWNDERVELEAHSWPDALLPWRDAILARAGGIIRDSVLIDKEITSA
jgi:hypothetical protein